MSKEDFLAYGDRHELEAVMRIHSVKRWHMIDTTRQQTLAEHSANVALLGFYLAAKFEDLKVNPYLIAAQGLMHDIAESFTGDIPTHTKRLLHGIDYMEGLVIPELFQYQPSPSHKILIKLCDLADGIRFIRLHGVDGTARHARGGLEKQFAEWINMGHDAWGDELMDKVVPLLYFYAYEDS